MYRITLSFEHTQTFQRTAATFEGTLTECAEWIRTSPAALPLEHERLTCMYIDGMW